MKIRAIAFALPLVVGIAACKTSSSQGSTGSTAAGTASTEGQGNAGQPQADQQTRGAAGPTASGDASAANKGEASGSATATPGMGTSGSATGTADTSTGSATASGDVYGTSPGASGSASGTSGDVKGHSDDQVVKGKISKVSSKSVTITTDDGADKMLHVVPETTIEVDGKDARNADLQEGQPVRASYSEVEGRDVAVEIHAGKDLSGSSGSTMQEPSTSGTTGSDRKY